MTSARVWILALTFAALPAAAAAQDKLGKD